MNLAQHTLSLNSVPEFSAGGLGQILGVCCLNINLHLVFVDAALYTQHSIDCELIANHRIYHYHRKHTQSVHAV